jgi:hemolysin activation/secretion protein
MKIKACIVVLTTLTMCQSLAEMQPTLIDPNNPARLSRDVPIPAPQPKTIKIAPTIPKPSLTPNTLIEVNHIQFIGGTRFPLETLVQPFRGFIGKTVPLSKLLAATDTLTQHYHNAGYPLSYAYIPADNFQHGVLKIELVEGYIANTHIHSDNTQIGLWLTTLSQQIMAEKPLTQNTFDRYSILMARTPDTKVTATANPPNNIYGATDMEVNAQRTRNWNVSTTFDTRKDQSQALVNATLSGLTRNGEQLGVATLLPLDNQTRESYFGLNYQQYLGNDGLQIQLKGSFFQQNPKDYSTLLTTADGVNINSKEKETQYSGGVALNYPLLLTQKQQWTLGGELDYVDKDYTYNLQAQGFGQQVNLPDIDQHVRYPAAEISLTGSHQYSQAAWNTRFSVRQGVDSLGASNTTANTDLTFTRWRFNGDAAYVFDKKWRLSSSIEGDWSDNALPEPERASFGALHYGRGYPDSDATGDYGVAGQVEMRYLYNRNEGQWVKTVQPYVLVDTAHTGFNQPGLPRQALASYAVGVMFGDNSHYSLSLEGARPIGDVPTDSSNRDWRFSATFTYNFNGV